MRALLICFGLLMVGAPAAAQAGDPVAENRALQAAASLESRGDYEGAEEVLRALLREHPTSTGGLFALERVLRARGRVAEVLGRSGVSWRWSLGRPPRGLWSCSYMRGRRTWGPS